jgi:deoxyribodipyrimidine photo-lyase
LARAQWVSLLPLITIDNTYQHDNLRQLIFLVDSLVDLSKSYTGLGWYLNIFSGDTKKILIETVWKANIGMIVASASYVRYFRDILLDIGKDCDIPVILIDDNALLPANIVSDHEEYGAYTLRKKYWYSVASLSPEKNETYLSRVECIKIDNILPRTLDAHWYKKKKEKLEEQSWGEKNEFPGGELSAQKQWKHFLDTTLWEYETVKNNPNIAGTSLLSPYLHFGCISPIQIYQTLKNKLEEKNVAVFLEELLVRRELSINMWHYNPNYNTWESLPDWVIKTLDEERSRRPAPLLDEYTLDELKNGKTHDPLWNAAQKQLIKTGKIHGYVRMYWGKQLLRWFHNWRKAYEVGVLLNDVYAIDGCSPNGYTGIAWCFGKHDRPFPPKKVHYGLIRSMTAKGMQKKFDTEAYIKKWS